MHYVFLNQYYPPDAAPTGVMLRAVVEELAAQGHEVTVICAEGGYAGGERRTSNVERRISNGPAARGENEAAVCDRRSKGDAEGPCEDPPSTIHDPRSTIRVLRIRATRFGRGTFLGKVVDYLSYYVGVAWQLMFLKSRPERIVALTTPPYLSVLARICSKLRGGDHAHWVMDLYPDVMVAHGMLREGAVVHRWLAGLARWGFGGKRCAALLTLGPDMAERVGEMVGTACPQRRDASMKKDPAIAGRPAAGEVGRMCQSDPTWIPLWSGEGGEHRTSNVEHGTSKGEEELGMAVGNCGKGFCNSQSRHVAALHCRHERGWREDELVVMYSGNMGLGHRFGEILEVIGRDSNPTRFVFFGGGKRRGEIERFVAEHPEAAVELHDYAPAEDLGVHLRSADVHLASLAAEWTGTMVPSKLQGIFHAGRPVIFIGDARSSIGRWVTESGGGWVVAPGDVAGLERAIDEARDPAVREWRGRAAKDFADTSFDKPTNVRRVAGILL